MGRVLRIEVADDVLRPDGSLDIQKAKPLMMMGSQKGMNFCSVCDINKFESFSAMFHDGNDQSVKE